MTPDEPNGHGPGGGSPPTVARARRPRGWLALLPLVTFLALAALFASRLLSGDDLQELPSPLVGSAMPEVSFPPLGGVVGESGDVVPPFVPGADPEGRVRVVNFWASWCLPCRAEHPVLMALSERADVTVSGIAFKNEPADARRFLAELGNPFSEVGLDPDGRGAIEWGVGGVPETFVIGPDGTVVYRRQGPIDGPWRERLLREIEKAGAAR